MKLRTRIISLALLAASPAFAVTYPCQPAFNVLPVLNPSMVVGDKRGPLTISTADGSGAYWYCQDAKGVITAWQYHATIAAQNVGLKNWYMHLTNWGQTVITESRTADCSNPATLVDDPEKRLCAAIVTAVQTNWPKK